MKYLTISLFLILTACGNAPMAENNTNESSAFIYHDTNIVRDLEYIKSAMNKSINPEHFLEGLNKSNIIENAKYLRDSISDDDTFFFMISEPYLILKKNRVYPEGRTLTKDTFLFGENVLFYDIISVKEKPIYIENHYETTLYYYDNLGREIATIKKPGLYASYKECNIKVKRYYNSDNMEFNYSSLSIGYDYEFPGGYKYDIKVH